MLVVFPQDPEIPLPPLHLIEAPGCLPEAQLGCIWKLKALASFPAPGLRVDSLFSLPDASSNTGNSGAAGSPSQAVNFPSAGNVQLRLAERSSLCPDLGEAAAEQAQALVEGMVMAQLNRSQGLTFIKPGLVLTIPYHLGPLEYWAVPQVGGSVPYCVPNGKNRVWHRIRTHEYGLG